MQTIRNNFRKNEVGDSPCYGCTAADGRSAICHTAGNCPHGYTEWAERNAAARKKESEIKTKNRVVNDYVHCAVQKAVKAAGGKK